jgi:hypothetical protein
MECGNFDHTGVPTLEGLGVRTANPRQLWYTMSHRSRLIGCQAARASRPGMFSPRREVEEHRRGPDISGFNSCDRL